MYRANQYSSAAGSSLRRSCSHPRPPTPEPSISSCGDSIPTEHSPPLPRLPPSPLLPGVGSCGMGPGSGRSRGAPCPRGPSASGRGQGSSFLLPSGQRRSVTCRALSALLAAAWVVPSGRSGGPAAAGGAVRVCLQVLSGLPGTDQEVGLLGHRVIPCLTLEDPLPLGAAPFPVAASRAGGSGSRPCQHVLPF